MTLLNVRRPDHGVLFVVSGPSGVGKSTLVKRAMRNVPGLAFSVSATTRRPRRGEVDGEHYHFLTPEAFAEGLEAGRFLEHATVYGQSYGTLAAPTHAALASGRSLILDIDVQGSRQIRETLSEAVHVFVLPPDLDTLEARLRGRDTDSEETIRRRMAEVDEQLRGAGSYDYIVVNDDLPGAAACFQGILLAETCRRGRRASAIDAMLADLAARRA